MIKLSEYPITDFVCVDTETDYDRETYSVAGPNGLNSWTFAFDERFNCYMVSAYSEDLDIKFADHPSKFDWELVHDKWIICHNATFDGPVLFRMQQDGIIPKHVKWKGFVDTADLAAYLRCNRTLKAVAKVFYNEELNKEIRERMDGKTVEDARAEGWEDELTEYAMWDAIIPYKFFKDHRHLWPDMESAYSDLNRRMGWEGIRIDIDKMNDGMNAFKEVRFDAQKLMPWEWDKKKHKTPIAPSKRKEQCRLDKIPCPASFDKRDPKVKEWFSEYVEDHPWIGAVRDWDQANTYLGNLKVLESALREDDTYPFQIKYFGAHTGRGSGTARFNMQNLPREPILGVNIRNLFIPKPGNKFIVIDFESIEGVLFAWMAGCEDVLKELEAGANIYEIHARNVMGLDWPEGMGLKQWDKKNGTNYYTCAKVETLALGYQGSIGALTAYCNMYGLEMTSEEKTISVQRFRNKNPKHVQFWRERQQDLNHAAAAREDCVIDLPSGYPLTYHSCLRKDGGVQAVVLRGTGYSKVYGGLVSENIMQCLTGSILREASVRAMDNGFPPIVNVHDELIIEVKEDTAEEDFATVKQIIEERPAWAPSCPIRADGKIVDMYMKI